MPGGAEEELERSSVEAALETRRELGLRYDAELVDGFAERIERVVAARVAEEHARSLARHQGRGAAGGRQLALGIVSLVACIPICIVLGLTAHLAALVLALAGIVGINVAHAWLSREG